MVDVRHVTIRASQLLQAFRKMKPELSVLIKSSFSRYSGNPVSIYAASLTSDDGDRLLVIQKDGAFNSEKKEGFALIVDTPTLKDFDMVFGSERFLDGLTAYQDLIACEGVILDADVQKHKPDNSIEMDGLTANGKINWRFNEVSNGQAAVLAICLYFRELTGFDTAMGGFEQIDGFFITI